MLHAVLHRGGLWAGTMNTTNFPVCCFILLFARVLAWFDSGLSTVASQLVSRVPQRSPVSYIVVNLVSWSGEGEPVAD